MALFTCIPIIQAADCVLTAVCCRCVSAVVLYVCCDRAPAPTPAPAHTTSSSSSSGRRGSSMWCSCWSSKWRTRTCGLTVWTGAWRTGVMSRSLSPTCSHGQSALQVSAYAWSGVGLQCGALLRSSHTQVHAHKCLR